MKKLSLLVIILFITFLIAGCVNQTTTELTTPTSSGATSFLSSLNLVDSMDGFNLSNTILVPDESVTFDIYSIPKSQMLPEKHFEAKFFNIVFTPIKNLVSFSIQIKDKDYKNAIYVVGIREANSTRLHSYSTFRLSIKEAYINDSFHLDSNLKNPEIVISKHDLDDYNPSRTIDPVAGFYVRNPNASKRKVLGGYSYEDHSSETATLKTGLKYVQFNYSVNDPQEIIQNIKFVLYDDEFGINIISYIQFNRNQIHIVGGTLYFVGYKIGGAIAKKGYKIAVLISGNDGVVDFENLLYSTHFINHYRYGLDYKAYHDMYAYFDSAVVGENDIKLNYVIHNKNNLVYSDTLDPVGFRLAVVDLQGNVSYAQSIEDGNGSVIIPFDKVKVRDRIMITDSRGKEVYAVYVLVPFEPKLELEVRDGKFCITVLNDYITHVYFELSRGSWGEKLVTYNFNVQGVGTYSFDLGFDLRMYELVSAFYIVSFYQFGDLVEHQWGESLRVAYLYSNS